MNGKLIGKVNWKRFAIWSYPNKTLTVVQFSLKSSFIVKCKVFLSFNQTLSFLINFSWFSVFLLLFFLLFLSFPSRPKQMRNFSIINQITCTSENFLLSTNNNTTETESTNTVQQTTKAYKNVLEHSMLHK